MHIIKYRDSRTREVWFNQVETKEDAEEAVAAINAKYDEASLYGSTLKAEYLGDIDEFPESYRE